MQKITPYLWFNGNAEEAMDFYVSVFKDAEIISRSYYKAGGPMPEGALLIGVFKLNGQQFMVLNGGAQFKFSEAVSFLINCETQEEVDHYWENLTAEGGAPGRCGWLKDRFGLSWQVVPTALGRLMQGDDAQGVARTFQAMMQMGKMDIAKLEAAYHQKE
ncbi:VOC family protein [Mucilaginibacter sp.]